MPINTNKRPLSDSHDNSRPSKKQKQKPGSYLDKAKLDLHEKIRQEPNLRIYSIEWRKDGLAGLQNDKNNIETSWKFEVATADQIIDKYIKNTINNNYYNIMETFPWCE